MICTNCGNDSYHIKVTVHGESCEKCGGFSATSGARVDGSMARNSFRVREQQQHYEGDMLQPHRYNHHTRRAEPNQDFIDRYPDKAKNFYTPAELRNAGMKKLAKAVEKETGAPRKPDPHVKFKGSAKKAIKRLVGSNGKR